METTQPRWHPLAGHARQRHDAPSPSPATCSHDIEAVVFELRDVLYDESAWRRWLYHLLSRFGLHAQFEVLFHAFDEDYRVTADEHGYWAALRSFLRSAGLTNGQADEVEAAARPQLRKYEASIRLFPGVRAVLGTLAERRVPKRLAVGPAISPLPLPQRLTRLRLAGSFEEVHASANAYDTTWFDHVASALRTAPSKVAYVGNDPRSLATASSAGLVTLAFNATTSVRADLQLDRIDRLVELLRIHQSEPPAQHTSAA